MHLDFLLDRQFPFFKLGHKHRQQLLLCLCPGALWLTKLDLDLVAEELMLKADHLAVVAAEKTLDVAAVGHREDLGPVKLEVLPKLVDVPRDERYIVQL